MNLLHCNLLISYYQNIYLLCPYRCELQFASTRLVILLKMKQNLEPTIVVIAATTVATIVGAGVLFWRQNRKRKSSIKLEDMVIPTDWTRIGEIGELIIYPLKGGRRKCLVEAEVTKYGLRDMESGLLDRGFMVINENNDFINMKRNPKIVLVETTAIDKTTIKFTFPEAEDFVLNLKELPDRDQIVKQVDIYGSNSQSVDCGEEAAKWFSQRLLGKDSGMRLGYFLQEALAPRILSEEYAKAYDKAHNDYMGAYADIASYMLMSEESLNDLNSRLEKPVSEHNFRPNIMVSESAAYNEDKWDWIRLGDLVVLRSFKYCTRCVMVTMDPDTGKSNPTVEPLRTLRKYRQVQEPHLRKVEGNSPVMGMYAGCHRTGFIRVGDKVSLDSASCPQ